MTPEQIEMHRKRFEELANETPGNLKRDFVGRYIKPRIKYLWWGYLLCAENIEKVKP